MPSILALEPSPKVPQFPNHHRIGAFNDIQSVCDAHLEVAGADGSVPAVDFHGVGWPAIALAIAREHSRKRLAGNTQVAGNDVIERQDGFT